MLTYHLIENGELYSSSSSRDALAPDYEEKGFVLVEHDLKTNEVWDVGSQSFVVVSASRKVLTPFEFRSQFTLEEKIALDTLSESDPVAKTIEKDFRSAQEINLDHTDTVNGLEYFVTQGVLTSERVAEIREGV